eukprot:8238256-Pyramimonas_sp.AAC.1
MVVGGALCLETSKDGYVGQLYVWYAEDPRCPSWAGARCSPSLGHGENAYPDKSTEKVCTGSLDIGILACG